MKMTPTTINCTATPTMATCTAMSAAVDEATKEIAAWAHSGFAATTQAGSAVEGCSPSNTGQLSRQSNRNSRTRHFVHSAREAIPATCPGDVLGTDKEKIDQVVERLANDTRDTFVVPACTDRTLVGHAAYPGGAFVNPYIWAPVVAQLTAAGDTVWEVGPAWHSSAQVIGDLLVREVVQVQPPNFDGDLVAKLDTVRAAEPLHANPDKMQDDDLPFARTFGGGAPALILLPLPLPCDTWSISDCLRALRDNADCVPMGDNESLRLWPALTGVTLGCEHAEFSADLYEYTCSVENRLNALEGAVGAGAVLCVAVPMAKGLPAKVRKIIQRSHTEWCLLDQRFALDTEGMPHRGNGTPLLGWALMTWRVR